MNENLFVLERAENTVGKRRNMLLPIFSSFPTMFSEGFCFRVVNSCDCMVKGLAEENALENAALFKWKKIIDDSTRV